MKRITFLILILFLALNLYPQSLEDRILNLKSLEKNSIMDTLNKIYWDVHSLDTSSAKRFITMLLRETQELGTEPYQRTKGFTLKFDKKNFIQKLDTIYFEAKKDKLLKLMGWTYEVKSEYYNSIGFYDSSMTNILRAREIYETGNFNDDLVTVLHNIGDLYFTAENYVKARNIYEEVIEKKGDIPQWERWRKRVIQNNLALIDIKEKKYEKALTRFHNSLKEFEDRKLSSIDSIAITYIEMEIAGIYFLDNNFEQAKNYYRLAIEKAKKYDQTSFIANLYLLNSKLHFNNNNIDSARYYALKSEALEGNEIKSLSFRTDLASLLVQIFERKNDFNNQLYYYKKATKLRDTLFQQKSNWKYLQLLSEYNYEKVSWRLKNEQTINRWLIIAGLSLFLSVLIFSYFNYRLKKANLILVRKSLNAVKGKKYSESIISENEKAQPEIQDQDDKQLQILIDKLNQKMQKDKLYLKKDLNIKETAESIETNRTYLSKAINTKLNLSFTAYINSLRIEEAIRLINEDYFLNYNLTGIANTCGFNSRSAFFKSFKAHTGVSPTFFMNNYKNS